jgi:probable HAF family extracellular repeat protein
MIPACSDRAVAPPVASTGVEQASRNPLSLEITDLGTLIGLSAGRRSEARGINTGGDVVGWCEVPGPLYAIPRAVAWRGGQIGDLGTLGGLVSEAWGINADGVIVGESYTPGNVGIHAVVWRDGVIADLGTLVGFGDVFGSMAYGIDPVGRIVGRSMTGARVYHAVMWEGGSITDLGTLGGATSVAYAISPSGTVVGSSETEFGATHAFLWRGGTMTDLGTLGGTRSVAYAINPAGDVVGSSTTSSGEEHATLWPKGGGVVDLGTLGRAKSVATGINPAGQIVGYFVGVPYGTPSSGAFLWQKGEMVELPGVLRAVPGLSGEGSPHAYAINPAGQIVGDGLTDYKPHAALWSR